MVCVKSHKRRRPGGRRKVVCVKRYKRRKAR